MKFDFEVTVICPFCGETSTVAVVKKDYDAWQWGELIQNVMPYLSPSDREILISGMCLKCQSSFFSCCEEEDEDFEPDDIDDDCGFDPYEGCFTYDC